MSKTGPGFYIFGNPDTGEKYVGSTGNLSYRKSRHLSDLKKGVHHNRNLQEAFDKNPNFDFVGTPTENREEAYSKEQELLRNESGLLNIATDAKASSKGLKASEETRRKQSERKIELFASEETSAITRLKMSEAKKGVSFSHEHKQNIAKSLEHVSTQVEIDGVKYISISEASRQTGLPWKTIKRKFASK
jgi:group I intron endonuclease